jgi:CheY-like chemotaxis protein
VKAATILIVDDDADMRRYLRGCLVGLGPAVGIVVDAADGEEALRRAREDHVDLVISDVILPRLDGRALLKAIRSDPGLTGVAVLLISGQDELRSPEAPADGWLSKPFNARQLLDAVQRLLTPSSH